MNGNKIRTCFCLENSAYIDNYDIEENSMKAKIHPKYKETTITCGCGNVVTTKSTSNDLSVEICAACHPLYSGKQKIVDTAGRVERFRKKYGLKDESETEN